MLAYRYLKCRELSPTDTSASIVLIRAVYQVPAVSNHRSRSVQHLVDLGIVDYLQDRQGKTGIDRDQGAGGRSYLH